MHEYFKLNTKQRSRSICHYTNQKDAVLSFKNPYNTILLMFTKNVKRYLTLLLIQISIILPAQERPKVGVVLSGGGAKGIAHVGVLKVLEREGIPIDYITGTSMGALVGGLYAIGYTADELDRVARSLDWEFIISDQIRRRDLSFDEKENEGKFFVPMPDDGRISLPGGVLEGQYVSTTLSRLCFHSLHVKDFYEFPIPFACVAADIEKGEPVVLTKGNLPDALRASMAIPNVFTPVLIDDHILVDGGIFDNLPAKELKKMGADIIIGINVGFKPYSKDELKNSFSKMLEQTMFIHVYQNNQASRELCDILISPDLRDANASSFSMADSLVDYGEEAAMKQIEEIRQLKQMLDSYGETIPKKDSIAKWGYARIEELEIEGNNIISNSYIRSKLSFEVPGFIGVDAIENSVNNLYYSRYFKTVHYEIYLKENKKVLKLTLNEVPRQVFYVGLHYDDDFKSSFNLKSIRHNFLINNDRFSVDLNLGENLRLQTKYLIGSRWKQNILFENTISDFNLLQYRNGKKVSPIDYQEVSFKVETQNSMANFYELGLGVEAEYSRINNILYYNTDNIVNYELYNIYGYLQFDTYDRAAFPTTGGAFYSEVKKFNITNSGFTINGGTEALMKYSRAVRITKRLTFHEHLYAGITLGDSIPISHKFYIGGIGNYFKGAFPFVGLKLLEKGNRNIAIVRADIQQRLWRKSFISLRMNAAKTSSTLQDLWTEEKLIFGYGVSYGHLSIVGPIEFSFMYSNYHNNVFTHFNIGYLF